MPDSDPTRTGQALEPAGDVTHTLVQESPESTRTHGPVSAGGSAMAPPGYEILGELGRGGMGVVYHVRHAKLNRPAALKTTLAGEKADAKDLIRFLAEAEAVAAVRHPHVVQVYEYGDCDGRPFLTLELCPNGSLTERLKTTGKLSPRAAAGLVAKLAAAVQAAHDQGIVHRDLKPSNVLFDSVNEPKVTDFGLAKKAGGSDLTKTHAVMGTPSYMAPEQARGETKFVGPTADVWALGVILYECLTGARPFEADDSWAVLQKVMNVDAAPMPHEVPRDLALITRTCLAKAPHERYATAQALADDLNRYLSGLPISVRPAGVVERTAKWVRRNPVPAALVASLFVGTAAATALAVYATREADRADREAENAKDSLGKEKIAADRADAEAKSVTAKAAEAQRLLGLMAVGDGVQLLNQSDATGAALHFSRVLEVDADNREAVASARERIANTFRYAQVPRLTSLLVVPADERIVVVSADGKRLASVRKDGTGRVWDVTTTSPLSEFSVPNLNPDTLAFSPSGKQLLAAARVVPEALPPAPDGRAGPKSGQVFLFDAATGKPNPTAPDPPSGATLAEFSPDGSRVLLLGPDDSASVWNVATGAAVVPLQRHVPNVVPSPVAAEGQRVVLADPTSARVFDLASGQRVGKEITAGNVDIQRAVLSADGERLGLILRDSKIQVWDVDAGEPLRAPFAVDGSPSELAFLPGGDVLVVSSEGVRRWDAESGDPITPLVRSKDRIQNLVISPSGDSFATSDMANRVILYASDDGSELTRFPLSSAPFINDLAISPDGLALFASSADPVLSVWGPSPGQEGDEGPPAAVRLRHEAPVRIAKFLPDGRSVLTVSGTRVARVWTGRPSYLDDSVFAAPFGTSVWGRFAAAATPAGFREIVKSPTGRIVLRGPDGEPIGKPLAWANEHVIPFFTPDSRTVILQGPNLVRAFSAETGVPLGPIIWFDGPLQDYDLSADRTKWLVADRGGVRIVDVATGYAVSPAPVKPGANGPTRLNAARFFPDSRRFVVCWTDGPVEVIESTTGRPVWSRDMRLNPQVFVTSDSRRIVAGDQPERLVVLDAETGADVGAPLRHPVPADLSGTSRDGRYAVALTKNHQAWVWDLTTGRRVGPPIPHEFGSTPPTLSPDGRTILTEPMQWYVRLYDVATGHPVMPMVRMPTESTWRWFRPDGRSLFVATGDRGLSELPLAGDGRAAADLVRLCELLAAHEVDDTGTLVPLPPVELSARWTELRKQNAADLTDAPTERTAWHRKMATAAAYYADAFAAAFHYRKLTELDPGNPEWVRRLRHAKGGSAAPELAPPPRLKGR